MPTTHNIATRVQAVAGSCIPNKLHPTFFTDVAALATKGLASLNANGRSLSATRWAGEARIRLLPLGLG